MRAVPFVVFEIVLEDPAQRSFIENNDVVQALPSNGPDQALNVGALPRALRCSQNFVNAQPIRRLTEFLAVRTVAVAQQVTRGVVPQEGLQELAGCFWKNRAPAIPYSRSVLALRQTRVVSALIALASCVEREPSSRRYGLGATDFNGRPSRESLRRATIAPLNGGLPDIPHAKL